MKFEYPSIKSLLEENKHCPFCREDLFVVKNKEPVSKLLENDYFECHVEDSNKKITIKISENKSMDYLGEYNYYIDLKCKNKKCNNRYEIFSHNINFQNDIEIYVESYKIDNVTVEQYMTGITIINDLGDTRLHLKDVKFDSAHGKEFLINKIKTLIVLN